MQRYALTSHYLMSRSASKIPCHTNHFILLLCVANVGVNKKRAAIFLPVIGLLAPFCICLCDARKEISREQIESRILLVTGGKRREIENPGKLFIF